MSRLRSRREKGTHPSERRELAAILRQDLASFTAKSFGTVDPNTAYQDNWHVRAISWHLEQCLDGAIKRLIITLPPRNLKSICASVAFPAWALGHKPGLRFICVSYSGDLVRKHALDCRAVMESPWYREIFPGTRLHPEKNTEGEFMTTKRGSRLSTSVGGTLTGRGGNFIIIDDPMKPSEAMSETRREAVKQFYDGTLYSRLDNKADDVIVLIMQRLHVDDLVGHVLETEGWVHLNIPAIAEHDEVYELGPGRLYTRRTGEVIHPARESAKVLESIKKTLGTYDFSAQYLQNPVPLGGNMIKWSWFKTYDTTPPWGRDDEIVQRWVTASECSELSDYSVGTTWLIKGDDCYLIDVTRERLDYPFLRKRVIKDAARHHASAILIEDKGSGTSLIQDLEQAGIHPIAIEPHGDKITRMWAQAARIEAGTVHLPKSAPWLQDFQSEVMQFPNGRHDDQVDSLSQFLGWLDERSRLVECRMIKLTGY